MSIAAATDTASPSRANSRSVVVGSSSVRGAAWGVVAVTIWGVYLAFARANVSVGIAPADLAFIRFAVAGPIMLPWMLRHPPNGITGFGWRRAVILAILAGPLFILIGASGFHFAPLSHGAVVQPAAVTVATLGLSALLLGHSLTRRRLVGAGVILVGLVLVAGPSALHGGITSVLGDALFATAGLLWALFAVMSQRWSVSPIAATAAVSVVSAAIYIPLYLLIHGRPDFAGLPIGLLIQLVVVHGVLSGVVAVFAFGRAVQLLGAPRAAAFPALVPVVAALAGIPIAHEFPATWQVAGLLIVTLGLLVTQIPTTLKRNS